MRKLMIPLGIVILMGLDQLSKFWVVKHIALGEVKSFLSPIFSLTYVRNYGAAFSILQNQQWLFTIITLVVMAVAIYQLIKNYKGSFWMITSLSLIIAGGLGNFIDRFQRGYVVDMIHLDFVDFAIFNVADSFLTIGVVLLIISLWKDEEAWK